jgi:hypothetical protein
MGIPTQVAGATTYTITATNSTGSATQTFTLTVTALPILTIEFTDQTLNIATVGSPYFDIVAAQTKSDGVVDNKTVNRLALVVLLHVSRHDKLAASVAQATESVEVMIDLLQMFPKFYFFK